MSEEPPDREWVAKLRRADPGAFDAVYRMYADRTWRFLVRLCGNADAAKDLYQETWMAVARNAHRLQEDTLLLPWLLTIARNKHRNGFRFEAYETRRLTGFFQENAAAEPSPEGQVEARARVRRLGLAFHQLPEPYREVLLLKAVEGLDAPEIGRVLGLRDDAVRKRLSRARGELAQRMGEATGEGQS